MTIGMVFVVGVDRVARCICDDALDLREIGALQVTRASHVEPHAEGNHWTDIGPEGGPVMRPYGSSSGALAAAR